MRNVIIYACVINVIAFFMYGFDKQKAKRRQWRIPESTLLGVAVIGGSIGAFLGMQIFRHKTKKPKFYIGVPMIFALQMVGIWIVF